MAWRLASLKKLQVGPTSCARVLGLRSVRSLVFNVDMPRTGCAQIGQSLSGRSVAGAKTDIRVAVGKWRRHDERIRLLKRTLQGQG